MTVDGDAGGDTQPDGGQTARPTDGRYGTATSASPALDQVRAVAAREYRLAVRTRRAPAVAVLFGVFTAAVVQFGASSVGPGQFDAVVASIAELGVYVVPLAALAAGYDAVVGADETGSLDVLLALPVSRRRLVAATYLGRAGALAGATVVGFVPGAVLVVAIVGVGALGVYSAVALAAVLLGWAFLAIGVFVSTVATDQTRALGGALVAWLWFVLLHDLVALAAVATLDLSGRAIAAMVVLNPADGFRVLVLQQVDVVAGGFGSVMQQAGLSGPVVLAAMLGWIVVPVWLAGSVVRHRR